MNELGEGHFAEQQQQLSELDAASSKSKPKTLREFERALRDIGFSRAEAAAISNGGFKAVQADAVSEQLDNLSAELRRFAESFK